MLPATSNSPTRGEVLADCAPEQMDVRENVLRFLPPYDREIGLDLRFWTKFLMGAGLGTMEDHSKGAGAQGRRSSARYLRLVGTE